MVIQSMEAEWLGMAPMYSAEKGDEIWVILGCPMPLILRPGNDGYRHICAVDIPRFQDHPVIIELSSDAQPGDKIGLYIVEDVELV